MMRHLRSTAELRSHSVRVQRVSGGAYVDIKPGDKVYPGELIRLAAYGLVTMAQFRIEDSAGNVLMDQEVDMSFKFQAWVDIPAPDSEGVYRVICSDSVVPFIRRPRHDATTEFVVSRDAGSPPRKPDEGWGGFLGNTKTLLIIGAVIAVAALGIKVIPGKR